MATASETHRSRVDPSNPAAPRAWYRFEISNEADQGEAHLYVYDYIGIDPWTGEGIGAKQFIDELNALPETVKTVVVHVNSPGGSVFDALPIANALREHRAKVQMRIEGLAASAATLIIMAGETIWIAENALVMIHEPSSFCWGTAKDLRAQADALDRVHDAIVATYRWHSELSDEELSAMMEAITWMDAEEAVANGFATEVGESMKAAAHFDAKIVAKLGDVPEKYRARAEAILAVDDKPTEEEKPKESPPAERPAPAAKTAEVIDFEKAKAELRDSAKAEARKEERERVAGIMLVARTLGLPSYGVELVDQGVDLEAARTKLFDKLVAAGGPEVLSRVDATATVIARSTIAPSEIYARRHQQAKESSK